MSIQKKSSALYLIAIPAIIIFAFAFLAVFSDSVVGQSADAIAIRVLPNSDKHYSALRWYKEKKFTGSPQSLIVDGYEAVRDGRTVYVNAANITPNSSGNDVLYTNIYVISYNQEAENKTRDIFGQILAHWRFNSNMTADMGDIGQCAGPDPGKCWDDSECPLGELCNSRKARIVRDTRRLADLAELKIALGNYKTLKGKYPTLAAGTYLPNKSLSVWPSWQKVLAQELALTPLPIDPENKLGDCGASRFNKTTCWDEKAKEFADSDNTDPALNLPALSLIYAYTGSANGSSYNVCAVMESGLVEGVDSGSCAASREIRIGAISDNHPPEFNGASLAASAGQAFSGFVMAFDSDGDRITWTVSSGPAWTGWSSANISPGLMELTADQTGPDGAYPVNITIDDGRGGVISQIFNIIITSQAGRINAGNLVYSASTTKPISYILRVENDSANYTLTPASLLPGWTGSFTPEGGSNRYTYTIAGSITPGTQIPATTPYNYTIAVTNNSGQTTTGNFTITVVNNPPMFNTRDATVVAGRNSLVAAPLNFTVSDYENNELVTYTLSDPLPAGLTGMAVNNNTYRITGIPVGSAPRNIDYNNNLTVTDVYGASTVKPFKITVTNNKPVISALACPANVRPGALYSCQISAVDPDGHAIAAYHLVAGTYPTGLAINSGGLISGSPTQSGSFNVQATAEDEYGAISNPSVFLLTITTFCGDGLTQKPNYEGTGGPMNNGVEDCDRNSNLAASTADSSQTRQYACTGSCAYTGGWCGDRTAQTSYGEECDPPQNVATSPADSSATKQYACANCIWGGSGWCGNGTIQSTYGEQCDITGGGGTSATDQWACGNACQWTGGWCGDTLVQSTYSEQCEPPGRAGGGTGPADPYLCTGNCRSTGYCGDNIINGAETCEGGNFGGRTCATYGYVAGNLACAGNCQISTSGCYNYHVTFADGSSYITNTLTFYAHIGGEAGFGNLNGINYGNNYYGYVTLVPGANSISLASDSGGGSDSCCSNRIYGSIWINGLEIFYVNNSNQLFGGNVYDCGGYYDTALCGDCCQASFNTTIWVTY